MILDTNFLAVALFMICLILLFLGGLYNRYYGPFIAFAAWIVICIIVITVNFGHFPSITCSHETMKCVFDAGAP